MALYTEKPLWWITMYFKVWVNVVRYLNVLTMIFKWQSMSQLDRIVRQKQGSLLNSWQCKVDCIITILRIWLLSTWGIFEFTSKQTSLLFLMQIIIKNLWWEGLKLRNSFLSSSVVTSIHLPEQNGKRFI